MIDETQYVCRQHLNDMRQACALKNVERMIQPLRQPSAQNRDLLRVPLFKEVQNPKVVIDFASNEINVVARKINISGSEFFSWSSYILKWRDL